MADIVVQFRGTIYENGYGQIAQKVMRDRNISTTAKAIYAYLCSFAGGNVLDERSAYPSVETMIADLSITEKTFYKHRNQLIDAGYVEVEQQKTDKGNFERNIYFIVAVVPSSKKYRTDDRPVNSTGRKNYRTVKSPKRKNYHTNIKRSLTINNDKDLTTNTTTNTVVAVQKQIESHLGTSISSLLPLLATWINEFGEQALVNTARYMGTDHSRWENIVGAYRAAITSAWEVNEVAATKELDGRYESFYKLFPNG